ncbi:lactococcin 972 family bacteriocin [Streptomonospora algeriensis]
MRQLVSPVGLTFSAAGFTYADVDYVGGGEWTHGISDSGTVYSNYYHGSSCHGSTAVGTRHGARICR